MGESVFIVSNILSVFYALHNIASATILRENIECLYSFVYQHTGITIK